MDADTQRYPHHDRLDLSEELAAAISARRAGVRREAAATRLLAFEAGTRELVGLVYGGDRALYFDSVPRTLVGYEFDEGGVDEASRELVHAGLSDAGSWVRVHGAKLDWVHPRYLPERPRWTASGGWN
jgi:hypothetical protein